MKNRRPRRRGVRATRSRPHGEIGLGELLLPPELHRDLAREAFESGRSINQLCLEAIVARKALRQYDPWKAVEGIWKRNRKVKAREVRSDVLKATSEVRRGR